MTANYNKSNTRSRRRRSIQVHNDDERTLARGNHRRPHPLVLAFTWMLIVALIRFHHHDHHSTTSTTVNGFVITSTSSSTSSSTTTTQSSPFSRTPSTAQQHLHTQKASIRKRPLPFSLQARRTLEESRTLLRATKNSDRNGHSSNNPPATNGEEDTSPRNGRYVKYSTDDDDQKEGDGSVNGVNGEASASAAAAASAASQQQSNSKRRRRRKNADYPRFAAYNATSSYGRVDSGQYGGNIRNNQNNPISSFRGSYDQYYRVRFLSSQAEEGSVPEERPVKLVSVPDNRGVQPRVSPIRRWVRETVGHAMEVRGIFDTEQVLPSAKQTRLLNDRAYARSEPFARENLMVPPSLDDLAARTREPFEGFWISTPARLASFAVSYLSFPYLTKLLSTFVTMSPQQLDDVTAKFAPGVSILYGTMISLTLSILYNRQKAIQDNVALECSLLNAITRSMLSMFRDSKDKAIEAGQCVADQVRTLVRSSRGAELMLLMYSDPYARMLELIDDHEEEMFKRNGNAGNSASRISFSRDVVKDLCKTRANRLSDESLALPPTHFQILNILTFLILLGYTVSILPTVPKGTGEPLDESCLLFGVLVSVYVLFYNFASDLNNPFRGVYQLRRSCAASHLLELKWLLAQHPLLRGEVDFEESMEENPLGTVQIRSPGLGDFWFEKDEIYVDNSAAADQQSTNAGLRDE